MRKACALLGLKAADPTPPEIGLLGHVCALIEEANARRTGVLGSADDVAVLARWTGDAGAFVRALVESGVGTDAPILSQRRIGVFEITGFWATYALETTLKTRLRAAAEQAVGRAASDQAQGILRAALRAELYDPDSDDAAEIVKAVDDLVAAGKLPAKVDAESLRAELRGKFPKVSENQAENPAPLDLKRERDEERSPERSRREPSTPRQIAIETITDLFREADLEESLTGKYPAISKALGQVEARLGSAAPAALAELFARLRLDATHEPVSYLLTCLAKLKAPKRAAPNARLSDGSRRAAELFEDEA